MAASKTISLAAILDLNEATLLHGKLMAARGSDVAIDASLVERVGAQCIQVLMAAAKTWEEDKKSFIFEKVSVSFTKTMQLIGIALDPLLAKEIQQ